jgi:predicted NACHT family NTPase
MGRQATPAGIELANIALTDLRITRKILQARLNLDRQPIDNFFKGKSVSDETFVGICEILKLDWQMIAGVVGPQTPNSGGFETGAVGSAPPELGAGGLPDIDTLVQQVRLAIEPLIREQCGTMRVLDMDQPIELTGDRGIYTNVNILEKQSRLRSERELLEDCDFDNRRVREKRIPGLAAVEKHRRLMVLGKPGAGKTTFLKYLAMQCITGGYAADKVPFFVTLKDFAETDDRPSLVDYLSRLSGLPDAPSLLLAGRSLILLDGLDEVREEDTWRVSREIRDMADRFGDSQFVITCRIAAKEYTFERFADVEVADFAGQEIITFVDNWFRAKNTPLKAEAFVQRLEQNRPIQELAKTPILLTLLCLIFDIYDDFPKKRVNLYEDGVNLLLKTWDEKRKIERDRINQYVDLKFIKRLISYLAFQTFTQQKYLIERKWLGFYIDDFIQTLPQKNHPELCEVYHEKMVTLIQSQYGLLMERAHGIYSFSHLTFQEYFTALEIAATNQVDFLAARICEKRWREVVLMTVGIMRDADELLKLMKQKTDEILSHDEKLQQFLHCVWKRADSIESQYEPAAAIRAYYYGIEFQNAFNLDLQHIFSFELIGLLDGVLLGAIEHDFSDPDEFGYYPDPDPEFSAAVRLDTALNNVEDFAIVSALNYDRDRDFFNPGLKNAFSLPTYTTLDFARRFDPIPQINTAYDLARDPELQQKLKSLANQLPDTSGENHQKWWKVNERQWMEDLCHIMLKYRNIGHNWQFTDDQKALLQQYYDANLLLVECLNSDCYVDRSVREEIEATLLLPMEEIDKLRM